VVWPLTHRGRKSGYIYTKKAEKEKSVDLKEAAISDTAQHSKNKQTST